MDIWAAYVQRFAKPEAQMVLFVINQASHDDKESENDMPERLHSRIRRQHDMTKVMGTWEYVMVILDTTIANEDIKLKVVVPRATAFPSFQLWLHHEFPNHVHEPIPKPEHGGNEHDCWITFKADEAIKFRFMFPYVK